MDFTYTSAPANPTCIVCSEPAPQNCGRCKQAAYCSAECQQTDWNLHKMLCSTIKDFEIRPAKNMRRAIVFDTNKTKPQFMWFKVETDKKGNEIPNKELAALIGEEISAAWITNNNVRNRVLSSGPIRMFCTRQDASDGDDSEDEDPISSVTKTGHSWREECLITLSTSNSITGNVAFVCYDSISFNTLRDATFEDLRDSIDYVTSTMSEPQYDARTVYHELPACEPGTWASASAESKKYPGRSHKVKGVRVSCVGDGDITFIEVEFPRDHPFLLDTAKFSPLEDKEIERGIDLPGGFGLPLAWIRNQTIPFPDPDLKSIDDDILNFFYCLLPELGIEFRVRELTFGPPTSVDFTFIRGDLKDLPVEHMELFFEFFNKNICDLFQGCITKEDLAGLITSTNFAAQFKKCQKKYAWGEDIASPYEVESIGSTIAGKPLPADCICKKGPLPCCHQVAQLLRARHVYNSGDHSPRIHFDGHRTFFQSDDVGTNPFWMDGPP